LKPRDPNPNEHERFMELAAAATAGVLTSGERVELEHHLRSCQDCRHIFRQYQVLATDGLRMLSRNYQHHAEHGAWNESGAWNQSNARRRLVRSASAEERDSRKGFTPWQRLFPGRNAWACALAASLMALVVIGAWRLGNWQSDRGMIVTSSPAGRPADLMAATKSFDAVRTAQAGTIARLQAESSAKRLQLQKLQGQLQLLEKRLEEEHLAAQTTLNELAEAKAGADAQVGSVSLERDRLSGELREARQASERMEAELAALHSERDQAVQQLASVETRLKEIAALSQEQQRRLRDDEQYLSSDRDIRDLMTARNLYIADVFDVDSTSRTRKPFGRVFYTRGKSLLFYAFDLDRQPKLKNATFQVWGQKEIAEGEPAHSLDLGILYLDSESNRRWVLRFANQQTLSEIDAIFVTVEPHGGSAKPTGKPFLFAMLRKEANHP
jgi:hypothetical protein